MPSPVNITFAIEFQHATATDLMKVISEALEQAHVNQFKPMLDVPQPTLAQMEKVALIVRPTSWELLLRDDE